MALQQVYAILHAEFTTDPVSGDAGILTEMVLSWTYWKEEHFPELKYIVETRLHETADEEFPFFVVHRSYMYFGSSKLWKLLECWDHAVGVTDDLMPYKEASSYSPEWYKKFFGFGSTYDWMGFSQLRWAFKSAVMVARSMEELRKQLGATEDEFRALKLWEQKTQDTRKKLAFAESYRSSPDESDESD